MQDYFEPWFSFKTPIVRQLAFVIASPNIIQSIPQELVVNHQFSLHDSSFWQEMYDHYYPRLVALDEDPEELLNFMSKLKSTRLGLRFEFLMWFWLQDNKYHHYQIIHHSFQVIDGKNTLGELDFVLLNKTTNEVEHWEVALKYYLGESDLSLTHWYGLNRSDTLHRKLNHFSQKQFQFTQVQNLSIQKRYAVLKGQLYFPLYNATLLPKWINQARRIGTWGHQIFNQGYYRLQRHEWICDNFEKTSDDASWWCNGLYLNNKEKQYYMFRQAPILNTSVLKM